MAIHWLADIGVVVVILAAARLVAFYLGRASKHAGPELRKSRLHAALEGSRTGAWIWEISTRYFFCDSRACQHLGVPPGSLLGLDAFLDLVTPSDRARVELEMQRASCLDKPFELVACIRLPDGIERHLELKGRPETGELGKPIRITGALRDVTEERLRNAELRRQSQILAQVHDAIIATTPDGRILSWNDAAERIYGYPASEAIGRRVQMIWFEEDRAERENHLSAAAVSSGAHESITRARHKSGAAVYVHVRLALMHDADGETVGVLGCSYDVTDQREEQELLALQASALESIDDAVLVTNKLEKVIHANAAAHGFFARPGRKLVGGGISFLLAGSSELRTGRMGEIRQSLLREGKWSGELSCTRAEGGEPMTTRASVRLLDLESGSSWVWVLRDITVQRRAEAALKEREKRFRKLADSAPMMVWMTDAGGACEYVNDAWLSLAGMSWQQAQGHGWHEAIHPDDRAALERLIACGDGAREAFEAEIRMRNASGEFSCTLTRGAPRREGGEVVGYIGSAVDISNIKRAEEERFHLEQQALKSQKLHSLGVLAGGIAHDFNNMLVSILGFSDLALRELEPRHPARSLVEQIELGSRRAAALVEQVLTFAGKARRANEEVDLNQAVLEMVNLLELSVGSGIAFDLHLDPMLGLFVGDPAQVQQVVMNLVLNASDAFDGRGGRVRVRTCAHVVQPDEVQRWTGGERFAAGPCVMLEVHDDGCGMDAETLSQIFDPFFTTKFTGRGLGLSAVMGVVRSHSGAIQVESAPGQGARFRVLFPLPRGPVSEPGRRRPAADGEPCVLAIDDDPTVLEATRQMLQSGGVKVYSAQTEAEAVDEFERHAERIRLVILDVVMPDTTAGQIAARLEHIQGDVQILLTSGYSDSRLRPEIDGRTIVGFLPKPYTRDELLEAVADVCPAIVHDLAEDSASA